MDLSSVSQDTHASFESASSSPAAAEPSIESAALKTETNGSTEAYAQHNPGMKQTLQSPALHAAQAVIDGADPSPDLKEIQENATTPLASSVANPVGAEGMDQIDLTPQVPASPVATTSKYVGSCCRF